MKEQQLAIPSVPVQQWGRTYDPASALREGTVFPDLNLVFHMAPESIDLLFPDELDPEMQFAQVCFVLDDVLLYLDTHPDDRQALDFYEEFLQKKRELEKQADCGGDCAGHFRWEQRPLVWEGGHR